MGMDLVPVYEEGAAEEPAGTVRISPAVENNLGVRSATVERRALRPTLRTVGYVRWDEDRLTH
ncbi:MAG TPA: efflux transporter periplasmic adaptor subunit, partial [Halieaceae bacterium]|nr:efflux transporter periplasmic adaptor subunit [Halieaceae bacterium]